MTQTIQFRSRALIHNTHHIINKPDTEDNKSLLLSILHNLNNLYEKLNRLNNVIRQKELALSFYDRNKEELR